MFRSSYFTLSETALLEQVFKIPNYDYILSNTEYLKVLSQNYENYGLCIMDEIITEAFLKYERKAVIYDHIKIYEDIRFIFGITNPPLPKVEHIGQQPSELTN